MAMTKKKITLADGRYLIYFTFDSKETKQDDSGSARCCDGKCRGGAK